MTCWTGAQMCGELGFLYFASNFLILCRIISILRQNERYLIINLKHTDSLVQHQNFPFHMKRKCENLSYWKCSSDTKCKAQIFFYKDIFKGDREKMVSALWEIHVKTDYLRKHPKSKKIKDFSYSSEIYLQPA